MSYLDKIAQLAEEKKEHINKIDQRIDQLISERKKEQHKLIDKANVVDLPNQYFLGALIYAKNAFQKKDKDLLSFFEQLAEKELPKSRAKKQSTQATSSTSAP